MHSFQRLTQLRDLLVVNQVYLHPGKARKVDNVSTFNELESLVHAQPGRYCRKSIVYDYTGVKVNGLNKVTKLPRCYMCCLFIDIR